MSELDKIAADFRAALIPTVARQTPWHKMTPDSQQTYRDGTIAAMTRVLLPVVELAQIEIKAELKAENAAMRRYLADDGFMLTKAEDGSIVVEEDPDHPRWACRAADVQEAQPAAGVI